ncbi:HAD-IIA family hydrolase [Nioella sp. MMSF_3534]|uniref:HAD-IIA family hydrolase n=1 Tax=Nioella sp. MMSF_3534 TaxID=3046720 RepID=UPI00273F469D|nr:HAD hydrolase-like protein [Nioella sp. MMSF_3534]
MKTAADAFDAYEAIRHLLPAMPAAGAGQDIGSIMDIADGVDAFVFDAFGVLNVGDSPIPGAAERVAQLRARGKLIRVLSNAASYDRMAAFAKFARLGFPLAEDELITSRDATLRAMDERLWGVIAAPEDALADLPFPVLRLGESADVYDRAEGILFLSTSDWSDHRQTLLQASLGLRPRPVLIGNADLVAPRETGLTLEPGHYARGLPGDVRLFGKPFPDVYELVTATLPGVPADRIAMCGDSLHTDILGAAAQGWRSVLVTADGLFAGEKTGPYEQRSGIVPDWRVARI